MVSQALRVTLLGAALAGVVGCGEFETPSIVLDLRILGMTTDPPEIVTPVDPDDLDSIVIDDVEVCALVADPNDERRLTWNMVACAPTDTLRCDDPSAPFVALGFGTIEDPELAAQEVPLCATLPGNAQTLAVIRDAIDKDALSGFGGVRVQIEFYVHPEGASLEEAAFAAKTMLYSPQFPPERVANTNPTLAALDFNRIGYSPTEMPLGRCNEIDPTTAEPGETLRLSPIEPEGVREDYLVPTFDGDVRMFTESLTYAWYATAGSFNAERTGGPKDAFGNEPVLHTEWTAPRNPEVVGAGLDVRLWLVQRDERGGLAWFHSCVRVAP